MSVTPYIEFNNKAMEKLWIYLNNQYMFISDTDVANAFIKCDEELKKDCEYMTNSRDIWRSRAKHAEAEVEELKKKLDLTQHAYNGACKDRNCKAEAVVELANKRDQLQEALDNIRAELAAKVKRMDEITKERDSYHDLYTELKKDYDRLVEENKWLKARTNCLSEEVKWYRKHYKEQSDKIRDLKSRLNSIYGTELPDVKEEYTMTFIMDRENFDKLMAVVKEGMDNSKGVEYMRDFLKTFCEDHDSCRVCPLKECGSDLGRGFDSMSDEEIEKHYKIAINSGAHEKIKDAPDVKDDEKCGMYKLWDMLQHVSDYYYFGVDDQFNNDDCDATSMEDIIDIHDLDSFIESYEKWDKR